MDRVSSRAAAHLKRLEANPLVQTYIGHWSAFSLLLELCLSLLFIWNGPLHPIDYPTYLQVSQIFAGLLLGKPKTHALLASALINEKPRLGLFSLPWLHWALSLSRLPPLHFQHL